MSGARRRRFSAAWAAGVVAMAAAVVFGPGLGAWWARRMAARQLEAGAISRAQQWLDRAAEQTGHSEASELYALHCAACHGAEGDGQGRAARHLFPRPRDFRRERFRLVSTRNGVPTREDIQSVVRRGMPGTSMPAYDDLGEDQGVAAPDVTVSAGTMRARFAHPCRTECHSVLLWVAAEGRVRGDWQRDAGGVGIGSRVLGKAG